MYYLIIFLISLSGIIFLIGKKIILIKKTNPSLKDDDSLSLFLNVPDITDIKDIIIKKINKYGYIVLVLGVRSYYKLFIFTKKTTLFVITIIKKQIDKNKINKDKNPYKEKKEVSKFLKTISNYKNKINTIKEKIKEEEGLN